VPAALLLAGVTGLVYADPADRAEVAAALAGIFPPMRELVESVLAEAARSAAPVSILGAVGLVWGTSRFVVAFDDAIARVTGTEQRRGAVVRNLAGVASVVLMVGAIPASAALSGVAAFLAAGEALGVLRAAGALASIALETLPLVATIGATVLVYRVVPRPAPTWRAALVPGVTMGIALTLVARLFAFVAPRLIGAAALLGTVATVFVALAWLALSFQAILIGAAWVRERREAA
jgi:YihY family inner membrane protein